MTEQSVHIYAAILHGVKEGVNSTEANSDDFSHIAYIQALAAMAFRGQRS